MNQCSVQKPPSFMVFKFISAYVQVRSYTCLGFHSNILCCSSGKQYTSKWLWDWVLCFPAVHSFRVNRTCAEIKMEKLEPTKDEHWLSSSWKLVSDENGTKRRSYSCYDKQSHVPAVFSRHPIKYVLCTKVNIFPDEIFISDVLL